MTEHHPGAGAPNTGGSEWSAVNLNKDDVAAAPGYPEQPQSPDYLEPPQPPGYAAPQPPAGPPAYTPPPGYGPSATPVGGYPSATPDPYSAAYGYPAYPAQGSTTDGLAVASLCCGVASLMCCLPGPVALILGIVSYRKNRDAVDGSNKGMAIAGIVLGGITTALMVAYFLFILVVAVAGA